MANKPKYMRAAADRAVEVLHTHYVDHGEIPVALVREQAIVSGYSERHLRRLLRREIEGLPARAEAIFEVNEEVVTAIFLASGRLAQARRILRDRGFDVPSESTFKRHVQRTLSSGQLAYAKKGSRGFRDAQVYLNCDYPHRLHTVQLDHTELPIWVVPRGFRHAVKPWMTVVMDASSRYVLSWVITFGRPTSEEVRSSLISAITTRMAPDGVTPVGGLPLRAVWDRGLEFLADVITESCLRLDVLPVALPAYSPHLKGRLERFWLFLKTDCLGPLPGYTEGATDLRGNSAIATKALGADEVIKRISDWIDWYTTEHPVAGGATALEAWRSDGYPIREVAPEQLWTDMLIAKDRCKISKNGIRFDRIDWIAPEIAALVGRKVEIRYLPHDRSFIEVFQDGLHLCTALPKSELNSDQEAAIIEARNADRLRAQRRYTVANRDRSASANGPVHRLETDRQGRRMVVDDPDDLLGGGADELLKLLGEPAEDGGQLRLL